MNQIRTRMMEVYGYDTGPYENFINKRQMKKSLLSWIGILTKITTYLLGIIGWMPEEICHLIHLC